MDQRQKAKRSASRVQYWKQKMQNRVSLFSSLIEAVRADLTERVAAGVVPEEKAEGAFVLLDGLLEGRYRFAAEIWHDANVNNGHQTFPAELLLRARTRDGQPIKPLAPITTISNAGLQAKFDKALILAGIDQAIKESLMPVSINTSARNISSTAFWYDIAEMLQDYFHPEEIKGQLTFEVTEDDLARNPCREMLLAMKRDFGCKFAIDDFYYDRQACLDRGEHCDSFDWKRLDNLKDIIDYVKIDGETVEAATGKDISARFNLAELVARIKSVAPNAQIILERVKDADQAYELSNVADAVQGLELSHDRKEFRELLGLATFNFPPRPRNI